MQTEKKLKQKRSRIDSSYKQHRIEELENIVSAYKALKIAVATHLNQFPNTSLAKHWKKNNKNTDYVGSSGLCWIARQIESKHRLKLLTDQAFRDLPKNEFVWDMTAEGFSDRVKWIDKQIERLQREIGNENQ